MKRRLASVDEAIARIEQMALVAAVAVMFSTIGLVILSRWIEQLSFGTLSDLGVGLIPWVGMLGASVALKQNRHIGFSSLRDRLPAKWKAASIAAANVGILALLMFLVWSGGDLVARQWDSGVTTPAMELPRWAITLAVPVGAFLATIHHLTRVVRGHDDDDDVVPPPEAGEADERWGVASKSRLPDSPSPDLDGSADRREL